MRLNVFPSFSALKHAHIAGRNSIFRGNNTLQFFRLNYVSYFGFCKFCIVMLNSPFVWMKLATFLCSILRIIFFGAQKQMIGIYARRNVASVKYQHILRYFTPMKQPRHSVGFSFRPRKISVAFLFVTYTTNPKPTMFSFMNVFKEAFSYSAVHSVEVPKCLT